VAHGHEVPGVSADARAGAGDADLSELGPGPEQPAGHLDLAEHLDGGGQLSSKSLRHATANCAAVFS
jgi:hypothetical protein